MKVGVSINYEANEIMRILGLKFWEFPNKNSISQFEDSPQMSVCVSDFPTEKRLKTILILEFFAAERFLRCLLISLDRVSNSRYINFDKLRCFKMEGEKFVGIFKFSCRAGWSNVIFR